MFEKNNRQSINLLVDNASFLTVKIDQKAIKLIESLTRLVNFTSVFVIMAMLSFTGFVIAFCYVIFVFK